MANDKKRKRRWPRKLIWFLLFLVLEAAAFLTLGALWGALVEATWARWLVTLGSSLGAPLLIAAFLAGRVREDRALSTLAWSFIFLLALGAGLPWLVAKSGTKKALAERGLWPIESVAGPRTPEARASWRRFFGHPAPANADPGKTPVAGTPAGPKGAGDGGSPAVPADGGKVAPVAKAKSSDGGVPKKAQPADGGALMRSNPNDGGVAAGKKP